MATPAAQAYQDGDTRVVNNIRYVRQGGRWIPQGGAAGAPAAPGAPTLTPLAPPPVREPPPARPEDIQGQQLQNQRIGQQITQDATAGVNFQDENTLTQRFRAEPPVRTYEQILPLYYSVMHDTPDTRAGDLNMVYGTATILDPGSVVREQDALLVQQTAALDERVVGAIRTLNGGGQLTPETRRQLRDMLESRVAPMAQNYNRVRTDYARAAERYGFDPNIVTGTHPALPFRQRLDARAREATVAADVPPPPPEGRIAFTLDPVPPERDLPEGFEDWSRQVEAAYRSRRFSTPGEFIEYARGLNPRFAAQLNPQEVARVIRELRANPDAQIRVDIPDAPRPAISDARGAPDPNLTPEQRQAARDRESADAFIRAAADVPTLGGSDYIAAGLNTLTGEGTFGENLYRERGIEEYDWQNHRVASIGGSIAGGALTPTTILSVGRTAAIDAMRAGGTRAQALAAARTAVSQRLALESGIYGAGHGLVDTEGDISERVANSVVEGLFGAATAFGAGRYAPESAFGRRAVTPTRSALVDPVTERLNAPLEAASPAERIATAGRFGIDLPMGAAGGQPAAIVEKGLDIVPGSAGVMESGRRGLRDQVENAVEGVAGRYGDTRGLTSAGQALQRGARNWITRFDELVGRAYDRIPIEGGSPANVDNTRAALDRLTSTFQSNPEMAEAFRNTRLEQWRTALQSGGLSWDDLKAFRSRIGYEIGEQRFSDSPTRDELRSLYAALSDDMRASAEARGPQALRAFERANTLKREGEVRVEQALVDILGNDSRNNPEAAARAVQGMIRGGRATSNIEQVRQIRASTLKEGEWDEVASSFIRLMGQPTNSQGREFNPTTFLQSYADMSEDARNLLFGGGARRAQLRENLDEFVSVVQRLSGTNALRNTSQSAPGITAAGTVTTLATALWNPVIALKLAAIGAGTYGMARLWTNPGFVRWATGYARVAGGARPSIEALARQRARLARLADTEPSIAAELGGADQILFGEDTPGGR